ncbi:hypothetical protein ScPMuIL_018023 [Solemya velum]
MGSGKSILPRPNQPRAFTFPKRKLGQKNPAQRTIQAAWFDNKTWLHYDESRDLAFCHLCLVTTTQSKLSSGCAEKTFTTKGFSNWKDAQSSFKNMNCHTEATERLVILPKTTRDNDELFFQSSADAHHTNLKEIIQRNLYAENKLFTHFQKTLTFKNVWKEC